MNDVILVFSVLIKYLVHLPISANCLGSKNEPVPKNHKSSMFFPTSDNNNTARNMLKHNQPIKEWEGEDSGD